MPQGAESVKPTPTRLCPFDVSIPCLDSLLYRLAHGFRQRWHGASLRSHPASPPVCCFVLRCQIGAAQHPVREGGGKRIACAYRISHIHLIAWIVVPVLGRDQKATTRATRYGYQLQRRELDEQALCAL